MKTLISKEDLLTLVRIAVQYEEITLGKARELLGLGVEEMRAVASVWDSKLVEVNEILIREGETVDDYQLELDDDLIKAVEDEDLDEIKALLDKGADIYAELDAPVILSIEQGNLEILKIFENQGLIFKQKNLKDAAEYGHLNIVKYLVSRLISNEVREVCNDEILLRILKRKEYTKEVYDYLRSLM